MYCYTETMIKEKKKENENEDLPAVTVVSMFAPRSRTAKIEMVLGFPPLQFVMVLNDNAMLSRSDLFFLSLVYHPFTIHWPQASVLILLLDDFSSILWRKDMCFVRFNIAINLGRSVLCLWLKTLYAIYRAVSFSSPQAVDRQFISRII